MPGELVEELTRAGSHCEHEWRSQRPKSDWAGFCRNFKPVLALVRREAEARQKAAALSGVIDGTKYEF